MITTRGLGSAGFPTAGLGVGVATRPALDEVFLPLTVDSIADLFAAELELLLAAGVGELAAVELATVSADSPDMLSAATAAALTSESGALSVSTGSSLTADSRSTLR